jgi:predicted DNA-binding transcriptional regulator YafY
MRASRLLSILLLLQARGRQTAPQLARELEVSVRTIYRDVESLSTAGIPVYADRGPTGGFQLVDGFRTKLTGLTGPEAAALFLTGMPGAAAELGLGAVLAATELKLLAALPPELRSQAGRVRERFHLDAPSWFRDADRVPHLAAVADAVWAQRRLRVTYQRAWRPAVVTRMLDPLGLVLKAGAWYVVAAADDSPRAYRIVRIEAVETTGETFERPADFDLAEFWSTRTEELRDGLYRGEAVVRVSPRGRSMLFLLGTAVKRGFDETAGPPDAEGWVRGRIPTESDKHAAVELLRLGAEIEVLEPDGLRRQMVATAGSMVELYAR